MRPATSLVLSFVVFGGLVIAQALVTQAPLGAARFFAAVIGWMSFCVLTALFFVGVAYSFDETDTGRLKGVFSRVNLIATGLLGLWLAISLTSDEPPLL